MHIKTNEKKQIIDIHIESWDKKALPDELLEKILSFKGGVENEFMSFAFTEKLFLYIKLLFIIREKQKGLYLWGYSPLYGDEFLESLKRTTSLLGDQIRYATFISKFDNFRIPV